jgi:hypothetical protein
MMKKLLYPNNFILQKSQKKFISKDKLEKLYGDLI